MNNYKVIKSLDQYNSYCDELERIATKEILSLEEEENIDLLTVLIEKWDEENSKSNDIHPVEMLKTLMAMHDINNEELSKRTGIDKTVLSKILNYKKGFSKDVIRELATYFKVNQEAFNRPYSLVGIDNKGAKKFKGSLNPMHKNDDSFLEIQD